MATIAMAITIVVSIGIKSCSSVVDVRWAIVMIKAI